MEEYNKFGSSEEINVWSYRWIAHQCSSNFVTTINLSITVEVYSIVLYFCVVVYWDHPEYDPECATGVQSKLIKLLRNCDTMQVYHFSYKQAPPGSFRTSVSLRLHKTALMEAQRNALRLYMLTMNASGVYIKLPV